MDPVTGCEKPPNLQRILPSNGRCAVDRLDAMRVLNAVANAGSLSAAARELGCR
jgi:molybdenum-dependent DNA-binding transcriptional regulator ModE